MSPSTPTDDVAAALAAAEARPAERIQKLSYTHDGMIDVIVANPAISQGELAAMFGYSQSWMSIVMSTDMFKARLAQRRSEIVNPALTATVEERWEAVTKRSLEVIQEKLSQDPLKVPDQLALRAAELGAKALGTGGNAPPAPPSDHLNALASRLTAFLGSARKGNHDESLPVVEDVSPRNVSGEDRGEWLPAGIGAHASEAGAASASDGLGGQ